MQHMHTLRDAIIVNIKGVPSELYSLYEMG